MYRLIPKTALEFPMARILASLSKTRENDLGDPMNRYLDGLISGLSSGNQENCLSFGLYMALLGWLDTLESRQERDAVLYAIPAILDLLVNDQEEPDMCDLAQRFVTETISFMDGCGGLKPMPATH